MNKGVNSMEAIDHTFTQARVDLNFLCSKLSVDTVEFPIVGATVQRIERALVLLKTQQSKSNH
jgi:hypothetical protein